MRRPITAAARQPFLRVIPTVNWLQSREAPASGSFPRHNTALFFYYQYYYYLYTPNTSKMLAPTLILFDLSTSHFAIALYVLAP